MSILKISYNDNEISSIDITQVPVSINYNNSIIATINDGDIKTLCCNAKVMESDIVIGSKILNCSGKLMQGDIIVELVGSSQSGETWYFNDTIQIPQSSIYFNFETYGLTFCVIKSISVWRTKYVVYGIEQGDTHTVFNSSTGVWIDDAYRTIVLSEPATGDALAYLEANATKLS